jgi:hypothetical protein
MAPLVRDFELMEGDRVTCIQELFFGRGKRHVHVSRIYFGVLHV